MHILKFKLRRLEAVLCSLVLTLAIGTSPSLAAFEPPANDRADFNLNVDWKFLKKDDPAAAQPDYNDSTWETVSLPHTWNDIDTYQFWINDKHKQTLIGWYRKHFTLDPSFAGRKVIVEFECLSLMAKFYINGHAVGDYDNGVAPCGIDITDYVKFGADNVLSVQVDNKPEDAHLSWGEPFNPDYGGLNRDVILHVADKVYQTYPLYLNLGTSGTYIYESNFDTLAQTAVMNVEAEVQNDDKADKTVTASATVVDRDGNQVLQFAADPQTVAAGKRVVIKYKSPMTGIHFWSPDFPYLYKVYTTLSVDGKPVDVLATNIGIREYTFSVTKGLEVNGHQVYLKGYAPRTSMEWPCVGMVPDWMTEYDFLLMKQDNGNFCRPMHIAPKKNQVEAGDKFGVVMVCPAANNEGDEAKEDVWKVRVDIMRDVTIYFRNNPSVLFYEGCNQFLTAQHMLDMVAVRKQWDPNGGRYSGLRSNDTDRTDGQREYSGTMDGAGFQSSNPVWDAEYARGECPRRVWDQYTPALDPRSGTKVLGGYAKIAPANDIAPYIVGNTLDHGYFRLSTSEDMVLENLAKYWARYSRSAIVQPPEVSLKKGVFGGGAKIIWADSYTDGRMHNVDVARVSGAIDGARLPKEVYFGLQVAQNVNPQVYICGHWNYPAGTVKRVYVVSNTAKVQLQTFDADGKLIKDYGFGSNTFVQPKDDQVNHYCYAFENVAWQPGKIKATGFDEAGKEVATNEIVTAGAPAALKMTPIYGPSGKLLADGSDITMVDVEVVDDKGERCPTYEDRVDFTCKGDATFLGGYNSGIEHSILIDRNNSPYHFNIECGINRVFVRGTRTAGTFTLNVTGKDLKPASITLTSSAVTLKDGLMAEPPQTYTVPLGPEPAPAKAEGLPAGTGTGKTTTYTAPARSGGLVTIGSAPYVAPGWDQFSFDVGDQF